MRTSRNGSSPDGTHGKSTTSESRFAYSSRRHSTAPNNYPSNDAGRAARFVDQFHPDIRFVPLRNSWLTWRGNRWRVDRDGAIERMAIQMSGDMLRGTAALIGGADKAQLEESTSMQ
jgi:hypothetical protein